MKSETVLSFAKLAALGVAGYLAWRVYRGTAGAADAIGDALTTDNGGLLFNPANPENPINTGFNAVYQSLSGSAGTLGTDLYDLTHNDDGSVNGEGLAWLFGGPITWGVLGLRRLLSSEGQGGGGTAGASVPMRGGLVIPATAYSSPDAWLAANLNNPDPWAAYGQK